MSFKTVYDGGTHAELWYMNSYILVVGYMIIHVPELFINTVNYISSYISRYLLYLYILFVYLINSQQ